jgi:hypothetical protein
MTAHTPAPKASGVSALLASLSTVPPPPQPSVKENFLAVMLQALIDGPERAEHPAAATPGQEKPSTKEEAASDSTAATKEEKPSPKEAAPDPSVTSLLLALLAPPLLNLPTLPKLASHKSSAPPVPAGPSGPASPVATAETAGEARAAKTDDAEKKPPLTAQALPAKEAETKLLPASGTSVASPSARMSFPSERNEIAGRMEQKLPPGAVSAVGSTDTGGPSPDGGAKSSLSFSFHEAPSEALAIIDLSAKAAGVAAPVADAAVDAPSRASSSAPLEQLEQMISREVLSVRQAGAETLGVTLKLDSNTQLFLQLTTHNGLVQASVRLDRGSFAPEDAQWAQLQQSLARQNVELLPMTGGSSLNFQQPSEQRSRHPATREEWPTAGAAVPPAQARKQQKEQNRPRKNWESWA